MIEVTENDKQAAEAALPALLASIKGEEGGYGLAQAFAHHRTTSLAAQDGLEDNFRDALAAAYVAGATDVHNAWVEGVNGGEPDFGEAGWDYAHSIDLSAIKEQHRD